MFLVLPTFCSAFVVETQAQIQDYIIYQAQKQQVSVSLALNIARCESRFSPDAKNPHSSASGIYQMIRGTWEKTTDDLLWEGDQDVFDPKLNIIAGIHLLKQAGSNPWLASKSCWGRYEVS